MTDLISVIVTTYNRPDALNAVLRALSHQSDGNFEIVIADDGSNRETAALIARWRGHIGRRLVHVWHPDEGFRLAESRNRGFLAASGSYCIFLDGDCLPRRNFVAVHRRLAEPGWFVSGNRILLSPRLTEATLVEGMPVETWDFAAFAGHWFIGGVNRLLPLITLPLGPLRKLYSNTWRGAKTCNFALFRGDFERVDGFDARYSGWGLEDSDLMVRLLHAGVHRKDGRFATAVMHLWHPPADRSHMPENTRRLDEVMADGRVRAVQGLSSVRADAQAFKH